MKKLLLSSYSQITAKFAMALNNLLASKMQRLVSLSLLSLLLTVGFTQHSQAQTMYYLGSDGTSNTNNTNDAIFKINQDGTGKVRVADGVSAPQDMVLDLPNNRAFVTSQSFAGSTTATPHGLYKIDLTTGAKVMLVAANDAFRISSLAYDPLTDYIYFTSNDGNGTTGTVIVANDALNRIKSNGTGQTVLASSISPAPRYVALDIPNNKIYVYDPVVGSSKLMTFNLGTSSATLASTFNTVVFNGMDYDPVNNWIYYTTDNGNTSETADDALWRMRPNGSSQTKIIGNLSPNPNIVTVERTRNIAFVWNSTGGDRRIVKVDIAAGTKSAFPISPAFSVSNTLAAIVIPPASKIATLSAFTISSGNLSPAFSSGTTSYSASVTYDVSSITVTPTKTDNFASIKVNNTTVTSGSASGSIGLNYGDNTITTVVTAEDGLTTKTYTLTVNRAKSPQTITFNTIPTKTYGNADFAAGGSSSSALTVSYSSSNTAVATISGSNIHIVAAGSTTITASQAGDASYLAASNVAQTLTVDKASQTITFSALPAKTYGNADFAPGATSTSGLAVVYSSDNTAVATIVNNQVHIVGQGTANITAAQVGTANYNTATDVVQSLTVNKATVTVTAAAKTKVYGADDPVFTYTATGVVGTDAPTGVLTREAPADNKLIGSYAINQGTLSYGNNYNVTYVGANLTINKRPITVLPVGKTKVYGDVDPFLNQFQTTAGSLAPGDATGDQFGRAAGENVGTYLMTLGTKKFYGTVNGNFQDITNNYDVTVQPAYVTITAKPVTVTADAKNKTFGDAEPALTYTNTELAYTDSFTGALTRAAGETAGTYAISQGTLALNSNYSLTYIGANLTIDKKVININATAQSKTYGAADPALTYTADELAGGDSFSGALSRATGENFGTYAISQSTLAVSNGTNYTLNFTGANLTINKKAINVTTAAKSKIYGDSDPALTYTADALIVGDNFTGDITRAPGETFGNYAITQGTLALNSNYTLNYTGANLSIGKRTIDIYSVSRDKQYGEPDGVIGYSYSGTPVAGDVFSGALGREPGTSIGTYATTLGNLEISNGASYDLIFHSAPFNITQREIIVSGGSIIKIYGDADPALPYNIVSGSLIDGAQITGALTRNAGETAGPYAMAIGTLGINNPNHKLTFQGGYFEIDRAPLTIHIDNKTKVATKVNPPLTYSVTGFRNGDTEAAFTEAVRISTDVNTTTVAGDYPIYLSSNTFSNNYNISSPNGIFTVTPASSNNNLASITVSNGTLDPAFDPATDFYSVTIPNGSTSTILTPTVADPLSSISVGYDPATATPVASGTPYTVTVTPGNTEQVPINITAEDGSVKNYYFNISQVPSDSKLSNLVTSVGTITPSFDPNVTSYTLDVSAETDSLTITPTTHDPMATARVSGGGEGGATGAKKVAILEGGNPMNIIVRSADRTSNTFYQLYVKRPIRLNSLTLSAGKLVPAFDPNVTSYVAKISNTIPTITVTPQGNQPWYQLQVDGVNVNSGDASAPITVNPDGSTTVSVKITAGDGETSKTYTINLQHVVANASLAGLTLSAGTLSPAFTSGTFSYDATVTAATASIKITPTVTDPTSAIKVNGVTVASGTSSAIIPLITGPNAITTVVTSEDGTLTKTYTVNVLRPSANTFLSNISLSSSSALIATGGANAFTTTVPAGTTTTNVTAITTDPNATITVNGTAVASGTASPSIALTGTATLINVVVTAQDGVTTRQYNITVTHARSNNTILNSIVLSPSSVLTPTGGLNAFNATASSATSTVNITPTAADAGATIKVNNVLVASGSTSPAITLSGASTPIDILVTAEDGVTTRHYTVTVIRGVSSNTQLSNISLTPASAVTPAGGTNTFKTSVSSATIAVNVIPTAADAGATITVNNIAVSSGTASPQIFLTGSSTLIDIMVTAEDGISTRHYSLTVTRTGSSNTFLSNISLNSSSALIATGGANAFTTTVPAGTTTTNVTAITTDPNATITVNGTAVASGTASPSIALTGTATLINVVVTAQDGVTTRQYNITVTHARSNNTILNSIVLSPSSVLTPTGGLNAFNATASSATSTVNITPTAADAGATIKVNNVLVASGSTSPAITLSGASTPIDILVTAEDGVTTRHYTVTVIRGVSSNTQLSNISFTPSSALVATGGANAFTTTVPLANTSIRVIAVSADPNATIVINGMSVLSGTASLSIALTGNSTVVNITVTAENGVSTRNYTITVNKAITPAISSITANQTKVLKVNPNTEARAETVMQLVVHPGVSPNGDGMNDHFVIDGLNQYPTNKVSVMNAAGALIYETSNYGQNGNVFDGHANKNGTTLQRPGTYYYQIEYKTDEGTKRKSGYLVIKY